MYLDFLVKVPTVKGKITRRKQSNVVYIEYEYDRNVVESKNVQKNCLKETIYYSSEKIRRIPELRQNAGLTTPLLAGLVHTKLYLPATGAGVPYTSGFNTASGVASIVAADEGDEESRVLYNNGDGTWIDENGNLYEE